MDVLIIGGTVFVGRAIVDAARERGHEVTVFHRGNHPLHRSDVAEVLGDREHDLDLVRGRTWDAVIDSCGYVPRIVRASVEALSEATDRYVFISTVSVYADPVPVGADESAPLHPAAPDDIEEVTGETYGPLKVACERVVVDAFGDRALCVRPGIVAGPHDSTGRFPYWVGRLADGERVLAPRSDQPVQLVDAGDLGTFTVTAAEDALAGAVNASGRSVPFHEMLAAVSRGVDSDADVVAADERALLDAGVQPWRDLPLWLGPDEHHGIMTVDASRARSAGLVHRALEDTAAATLTWLRDGPPSEPEGGSWPGLAAEQEAELLALLQP